MLQFIGAVIIIVAAKMIYDLYKQQTQNHKKPSPKGGEIIDLSEKWIDMAQMPYRKRDQLLNAREMLVYENVSDLIDPATHRIFLKVRLVDILQLAAEVTNRQEYYERVKEKSIDLLVCRLPQLSPVLAIQIDPPSSEGKRKLRAERFLRGALESAGIGFLSVNPNQLPDPQEVQRFLDKESAQA